MRGQRTPAAASTAVRRFATVVLACALAIAVAPAIGLQGIGQARADDAQSETAQRVVRVGYMNVPGMLTHNADGTYEGYTYDYLTSIARFTGWTYEFVEAEGETSNDRAMRLIEMLDNGEVDIEGGMTYSEALSSLYEYPENSYGLARTALFVPESGATVTKTNYVARGKLTVAVPQASKRLRDELVYFCEKKEIELVMVECASDEELRERTLAGETDAYLDIDINLSDGFTVLESFVARPFYFAAPKGDRTVIDEIDATIQRINESNPALQNTLYERYFNSTVSDFSLTDEELAYARQHDTLRVGVLAEKMPLQTFDERTGEFEGVTGSVLDYLTEHAGLSFEVVKIDRTDDLRQALIDADVDIVAGMDSNQATLPSLGMSLTTPYMTTSMQLVYNKFIDPDDLSDKTLAVPWELVDTLAAGQKSVMTCNSLEECFKAVDSGDADYLYGTSYTTPYYMSMNNLSNLLSLPLSTRTVEICFGIMQPAEPELIVIIDKSIRSLSTEELDSIIYDNSLIDQAEQVQLFIKGHLLEFAIAFILALALVIALLAMLLRARGKAAQRVREENLRFQKLYSLSNEQFFEYSVASDTLTLSIPKDGEEGEAEEGEPPQDGSYRVIRHARALIAENVEPAMLDALTSPSSPSVDLPFESSLGEKHWIRIVSHLVTNDEGRPISVIGKVTRIDDEMREKMDLSQRAHHDGLTGLLNWETFGERAGELLGAGKAGAMLVFDTDDFKNVNDSYGHMAGDVALQRTAEALRHAFRPHDLIGRLGGDEFAVCVDGPIDHDQLADRCARIIQKGVAFADQAGVEHLVTLSVGGVELDGASMTYRDAYQQADNALYRAKAAGKNRFILEKVAEK